MIWQAVNLILSALAVDMESMLHADIMEKSIYKTEAEKASAHPITEAPPAYRSEKIITLLNHSTSKNSRRLWESQWVALHHFALEHVTDYKKVLHHLIMGYTELQ